MMWLYQFIQTVASEIQHIISVFWRTTSPHTQILSCERQDEGLIVYGRNASSAQWNLYLNRLSVIFPFCRLYSPCVKDKGNVHLNEAVRPIFESVKIWLSSHPDSPVILIGTSNGGRIVLELSNCLSFANYKNPLYVISLAGTIRGTKLVSLCAHIPIIRSFIPMCLIEELKVDCKRVQETLQDMKYTMQHHDIAYLFIGSLFDHLLLDSSLAFPPKELNNHPQIQNTYITNAGHSAVVNASYQIVEKKLATFLASRL